MNSKKVDSLVRLRDALVMAGEALNEYIETLAPPEAQERGREADLVAVKEETFDLNYEAFEGQRIGAYGVASKKGNVEGKFQSAFNVLKASNATIQNRYHGQGYEFAYWLFNEKIYRQRLKPKA